MDSWRNAAENLKWHFRVVGRGEVPLHMKWTDHARQATGVDSQAQMFLADLKDLLWLRGTSLFNAWAFDLDLIGLTSWRPLWEGRKSSTDALGLDIGPLCFLAPQRAARHSQSRPVS